MSFVTLDYQLNKPGSSSNDLVKLLMSLMKGNARINAKYDANTITLSIDPCTEINKLYTNLSRWLEKYNTVGNVTITDIGLKMYHIVNCVNRSWFHSINLFVNYDMKNIVNMVVEIPQATQYKMEINKEEKLNPITNDIKDGKKRKVTYQAKGCDYAGYPYHYGALPQTWENKIHKDERTGYYGDGDPVDVFDISSSNCMVGSIVSVKVLGAIAMIDEGETDWKVIAINCHDPLSEKYEDISDVPKETLDIIVDFLTNYKTPDGKPPNKFASKMFWDKDETLKIIKEMHHEWFHLVNSKEDLIEDATEDDLVKYIQNISIEVENH